MEREVSEVDRKLLLKKTYLDKISYFINRNPINQDELYLTVRKFFGEYLKLDYEFTYEELSQELNKVFIKPTVKERIDDFLIRLSESEYLEETNLGTPEINSFLTELDEIIQNVIYDDQPTHEDGSILKKVLKIKSKTPEKVIDVSSMSSLIEEINFHITNGNIDTAKKSYVELLKNYDTLNKEDKKKLHDDMNEVYERLQTLIKNPQSKVAVISSGIKDSVKKVIALSEETAFFITASNLDSAKKSYANTLALYDSLSSEDRRSLHPKINELYEKLQALSTISSKSSAGKTNPIYAGHNDSSSEPNSSVIDLSLPDIAPLPTNSELTNVANNVTNITPVEHDIMYGLGADSFDFDTDASNKSGSTSKSTVSDKTIIFDSDNLFAKPLETNASSSQIISDNTLFQPGVQPNVQPGVVSLSSSTLVNDFKTGVDNKSDNNKSNNMMSEPHTEQNVLFKFNAPDSEHYKSNKNIGVSVSDQSSKDTQFDKQFSATKLNINERKPIISKPILEPKSESVNLSPSLSTASSSKNISTDTKTIIVPAVKIIPNVTSKTDIMSPVIKIVPSTKPEVVSASSGLASAHVNVTHANLANASVTSINATRLGSLLKKINEDILMDKLDNAKETYTDALVLYKSMNASDKTKYYETFHFTFKKLDGVLHQKSLHHILDTHLSGLKNSQRPIHSLVESQEKNVSLDIPDDVRSGMKSVPKSDVTHQYDSAYHKHKPIKSLTVSSVNSLPVVLNNDNDTTRVYELIEEAYFNMDNDNIDLAMLKYFKVLDTYHKLSLPDKRKSYSDIYALFKKLSHTKRSVLVNKN